MKIPLHSVSAVIVIIALQAATLCAEEFLSTQEALVLAFPGSDSVKKRLIVASGGQKEKLKALTGEKKITPFFRYYEGISGDRPDGYAVIKKVRGKHGYITFMVVLDPELTVGRVDILALHERRGRPIKRPGFLSQFAGKNSGDPIRLNVDIEGVTGATISSRAVIQGVHNVLAYASILIPRHEADPVESQK